MSNENVFAAREGDWYSIPTMTRVEKACSDKHGGLWRCVTHDETFAAQLNKDLHISGDDEHVLVWICLQHGPETP